MISVDAEEFEEAKASVNREIDRRSDEITITQKLPPQRATLQAMLSVISDMKDELDDTRS